MSPGKVANLVQHCKSGVESWPDGCPAGHCKMFKSAAANLTMLQHCTVKQIQHFELANLHAALTLQVSNFLPSKAVTGTNLHRVQLQVLVAEQTWPCKMCKSAAPAFLTVLEHCTAHAALTLQVSNLLPSKASPDKVVTLQVPHCN